jgi:hypothetical protein
LFGDTEQGYQVRVLANANERHHLPLELFEGTGILLQRFNLLDCSLLAVISANIYLSSTSATDDLLELNALPSHNYI